MTAKAGNRNAILDFSPLTDHSYRLGQAFGFGTPQEIYTLRVLAWSLAEAPVIVNIGAGAGTSGLAFAESRPDARVFTVDISPGGPLGGLENERNAFAGTGLTLPTQILGDSQAVGKAWDGPQIDLLFIDGDHSYEGCLGDLVAWREHVWTGGLIVFHDYGRDVWPDVAKVIDTDKAMQGIGHVLTVDTLWVGRIMRSAQA